MICWFKNKGARAAGGVASGGAFGCGTGSGTGVPLLEGAGPTGIAFGRIGLRDRSLAAGCKRNQYIGMVNDGKTMCNSRLQ